MKPPTKSNNLYYIQWLVCTFGSCPNGLLHFLSHLWGQGLDLGRLVLGRGQQRKSRVHGVHGSWVHQNIAKQFLVILLYSIAMVWVEHDPTNMFVWVDMIWDIWWYSYIIIWDIWDMWWYSCIIIWYFPTHIIRFVLRDLPLPGLQRSSDSWTFVELVGEFLEWKTQQRSKKTPLTTVQCFHNIQHNILLYIHIYNIEYMDHFQGLRQDPSRNSMLKNRVALPWQLLTWNICWWLGNWHGTFSGGSQHRSGSFSEVEMAQKWLQAKFTFIPC